MSSTTDFGHNTSVYSFKNDSFWGCSLHTSRRSQTSMSWASLSETIFWTAVFRIPSSHTSNGKFYFTYSLHGLCCQHAPIVLVLIGSTLGHWSVKHLPVWSLRNHFAKSLVAIQLYVCEAHHLWGVRKIACTLCISNTHLPKYGSHILKCIVFMVSFVFWKLFEGLYKVAAIIYERSCVEYCRPQVSPESVLLWDHKCAGLRFWHRSM